MIKDYRDDDVRELFEGRSGHRRWQRFERVARRKLLMLDAAVSLHDLKQPPNNQLEELKSDRKGQYSIRINQQFRLCFVWQDGHAYCVEIVDYH